MNAAPHVSQAQPSNDAIQPGAAASTAPGTAAAGSQDFAAALSDAGGKTVRKSMAHKPQGPTAGGSPLPPSGNTAPLAATPPPPTKTDAPAVAVAAAGTAPPVVATGVAPGAVIAGAAAAQGTESDTSPGAASLATAGFATAMNLTPEMPEAMPLPTAPAGDAPNATISAGAPAMPRAPSMLTPTTPGPTRAQNLAALPLATAPTAGPHGAETAGTNAPANSAPSAAEGAAVQSDSTLSGGAAAAATDATAQALMGAASMQSNASATDSFSSDDAAAPRAAPASAMLSEPAAVDPAAGDAATAMARASAAATASVAASAAQALSSVAVSGAADKRTHGNTLDASLAGAANDGSIGAAQLLTSNASTDSAPTPTFKVAAGVDTAQFGQGVAERVSMMMDGNVTSAKLQVNPPALGPIEVRIALQGGHAQVSFSSHSAVTRDALESSSAKLREMLGSQGFSQVSVDISQRSFQDRSPPSQAYESAREISADAPVSARAPLARSASALLDAYA